MPAPSMKPETVDVVYSLLRMAATQNQPVAAVYEERSWWLCPICWVGTKAANYELSVISVEERAKAAYLRDRRVWEAGVVSPWINSRKWSGR